MRLRGALVLLAVTAGCHDDAIALLDDTAADGGAAAACGANAVDCGAATSDARGDTNATPACQSNADCASGGAPFCHVGSGRCVECLTTSNCDTNRVCDALTGQCADACSTDGDCTSGERQFCAPERSACIECRGDTDCSARCLLPDGRCVDCLSDLDCIEPSNPRCDSVEHACTGL